nr:MAG TPA: hypothetical protein [Caudoviricetes sp.]
MPVKKTSFYTISLFLLYLTNLKESYMVVLSYTNSRQMQLRYVAI